MCLLKFIRIMKHPFEQQNTHCTQKHSGWEILFRFETSSFGFSFSFWTFLDPTTINLSYHSLLTNTRIIPRPQPSRPTHQYNDSEVCARSSRCDPLHSSIPMCPKLKRETTSRNVHDQWSLNDLFVQLANGRKCRKVSCNYPGRNQCSLWSGRGAEI